MDVIIYIAMLLLSHWQQMLQTTCEMLFILWDIKAVCHVQNSSLKIRVIKNSMALTHQKACTTKLFVQLLKKSSVSCPESAKRKSETVQALYLLPVVPRYACSDQITHFRDCILFQEGSQKSLRT